MGVSFGTMVMTPVVGWIVKDYGWQSGFVFMGIVLLVPGILIAQIFLGKTKPEAYGLCPDGDPALTTDAGGALCEVPENASAMSIGDALRDLRFWVLSICQGTAVMTVMLIFVHQVPYALDLGIDRIVAASSLGAIGLAGFLRSVFLRLG